VIVRAVLVWCLFSLPAGMLIGAAIGYGQDDE
jgi:hypothetical protein